MKRRSRPLARVLALFALAMYLSGCAHAPPPLDVTVETFGSMHATIMAGERDAEIDLEIFSDFDHLYALGPMTGLRGEITVIDGRPSLAHVGPSGAIEVEGSFRTGAPFLVWASVPDWQDQALPASVQSVADLDRYLSRRAAERGLGDAVPFTITGHVDNVRFHVLNAAPDAPPAAGPEAHSAIQAHFESGPAEVTFVGFYSTTHQGIFFHRGALTHIHFQNRDNSQSGHVEDIAFGARPIVLRLPR